MADLKQKVRERLAEWERRLALALERTHIAAERERFQRELAEISTAKGEVASLSPEQLERVHDRLSRDPEDWILHRKAS